MPKAPPKVDAERMQWAEEYIAAAREHYAALLEIGDSPPHFPMAFYQAGLAIECLFRAYSDLVGGGHEAKHDLRRHAANGLFWNFIPDADQSRTEGNLSAIHTRWLNNHRYRSLASLRRFLNEAELYRIGGNRTVKGDVVSYNWHILLNATLDLLQLGIEQWEISKKKWKG